VFVWTKKSVVFFLFCFSDLLYAVLSRVDCCVISLFKSLFFNSSLRVGQQASQFHQWRVPGGYICPNHSDLGPHTLPCYIHDPGVHGLGLHGPLGPHTLPCCIHDPGVHALGYRLIVMLEPVPPLPCSRLSHFRGWYSQDGLVPPQFRPSPGGNWAN